MKRTLPAVPLLISLLFLSACGTFIGRSQTSPVEGDYYNSTKGNLLLLGVNNPSREAHGATVACWLMVVCPVITAVSLPLDIALDTVLVPFDALSATQ